MSSVIYRKPYHSARTHNVHRLPHPCHPQYVSEMFSPMHSRSIQPARNSTHITVEPNNPINVFFIVRHFFILLNTIPIYKIICSSPSLLSFSSIRTRFHSYIIIKARHKRSAPAIIPLILESFII